MSASTHGTTPYYYVPAESRHPVMAAIGLFFVILGATQWINGHDWGKYSLLLGLVWWLFTLYQWFGDAVRESEGGLYGHKIDLSYRWSMSWFIFSEVMFFAAFFGALFYARQFALPWLGGEGDGVMTNALLWDGYTTAWPTAGPDQVGGHFQTIPAWGLPLVNTLILLSSGVTLTIAHHALKANARGQVLLWLGLTVVLGLLFLFFQAEEYIHAYRDLNLTLGSGIYGSTFFMLTGFHGAHVLLGTIMLAVMWARTAKGHFTPDNHFGFEAAAWYWHFVDVVWLGLFLFVYVL